MKVKIQAGVEIDPVTPQELRDELAAWGKEITRGARWRKISAKVTADAAGNWTTDDRSGILGPEAGFGWSVMRLIASGAGFSILTRIGLVYVNEATASLLVDRRVGNAQAEGGALLYSPAQVVLNGGETLVLSGTADVGAEVTISGQVIELPAQLMWQLLGA